MYLTSKNAILYDIVLNHALYHAMLTPLTLGYMYFVSGVVERVG